MRCIFFFSSERFLYFSYILSCILQKAYCTVSVEQQVSKKNKFSIYGSNYNTSANKRGTSLFEYLAKTLKTPYEIKQEGSLKKGKKKPSDYFRTLSKEEGQKMQQYVNKAAMWNRNT